MTDLDRSEEVITRLLAGEDPAAVGRDADPVALASALRSLEVLSLAAPTLTPSRDLRASIVSAAGPSRPLASFARRMAELFQIDEVRAGELLASVEHADADPWLDDDACEGVRLLPVEGGRALGAANCFLIHIAPGVSYPTHRHLGDEWCLFLQGRGLEAGREWNPGDMVLNPSGSQHAPLAAVSDEPFVLGIVVREGIEFAPAS